jgi:hypothetical protein
MLVIMIDMLLIIKIAHIYVYVCLSDMSIQIQSFSDIYRLKTLHNLHSLGPNRASQIFMGEDPRLITQLRALFDSTKLPFFVVINSMTLSFEIDSGELSTKDNIKKTIFNSIRNYKALHNFLCNIISSLKVILICYDSDIRVSLSWHEFLTYLTDYRNPFLLVQLLPAFLEPKDYVYRPKGDIPSYMCMYIYIYI